EKRDFGLIAVVLGGGSYIEGVDLAVEIGIFGRGIAALPSLFAEIALDEGFVGRVDASIAIGVAGQIEIQREVTGRCAIGFDRDFVSAGFQIKEAKALAFVG